MKDGDDWTVAIEGQGDLVSFDTEEEAVRTARRIAESVSSEAVIHGDVVPRVGVAPQARYLLGARSEKDADGRGRRSCSTRGDRMED